MEILFKQRLQQLRKDFNLTQFELAEKINTTQRRISHMESGNVEPDLTTLIALAKFFDVTTDFLLGISEF